MESATQPIKIRERHPSKLPSERTTDEVTTLRPTALAVVATARSRAWRMRSMTLISASLSLLAVLVAGLVWAATAKVAITANAQGKVAPLGRVQVVAHAEGGAVRALNVLAGQHVKAGDVLIELDPTTAAADLKQIDDELAAHEAAIRRLEAEQSGTTPDFTGLSPELAQSEASLLAARKAHYLAGLAAATGELHGAEAGISGAQAGLRPLRERLEGRKKLELLGDASRFSVMEDEARIAELAGRLATSQASAQTATANISALSHGRDEDIAKSLVDHLNQETELNRARPKILGRLENLSVVAPLDGIVKSISVTGPGAVLKAGEALAEIVPDKGERLVMARLPAGEIGFVHLGQTARLTLMPPDIHFKPITGKVQELAPDSAADERSGQLSYLVEIKPDADQFSASPGGGTYSLVDGVPVSVTIVTGERTVLSALAGPLFAGLDEALGER
jgi:adhesin transport system membrane fusion protein